MLFISEWICFLFFFLGGRGIRAYSKSLNPSILDGFIIHRRRTTYSTILFFEEESSNLSFIYYLCYFLKIFSHPFIKLIIVIINQRVCILLYSVYSLFFSFVNTVRLSIQFLLFTKPWTHWPNALTCNGSNNPKRYRFQLSRIRTAPLSTKLVQYIAIITSPPRQVFSLWLM